MLECMAISGACTDVMQEYWRVLSCTWMHATTQPIHKTELQRLCVAQQMPDQNWSTMHEEHTSINAQG